MHQSIPEQGKWLKQVVTGHLRLLCGADQQPGASAFRHRVIDLWRRTLRRRSQKDGITWDRMAKLADDLAPQATYPSSVANHTLRRQTPDGKSRVPELGPLGICAGGAQ